MAGKVPATGTTAISIRNCCARCTSVFEPATRAACDSTPSVSATAAASATTVAASSATVPSTPAAEPSTPAATSAAAAPARAATNTTTPAASTPVHKPVDITGSEHRADFVTAASRVAALTVMGHWARTGPNITQNIECGPGSQKHSLLGGASIPPNAQLGYSFFNTSNGYNRSGATLISITNITCRAGIPPNTGIS